MEYAPYDNQAPPASWNPDQSAQIMQPQQQQQQAIKPDPQQQHSQPQPIVYGAPSHQPMSSYDMSLNWPPQMVPQSHTVIQIPQWSSNGNQLGHPITLDPNGPPPPVSDPCIHQSAHPQQSHYTQYSTIPGGPTYWNSDLVTSQPSNLVQQTQQPQPPPPSTTSSTGLPDVVDNTLIDNAFNMKQPNLNSVIQPTGISDGSVISQQPQQPTAQQQPPNQFDDQLPMGTSNQVEQLAPGSPSLEGPAFIEDALEVIASHAIEHNLFSGHRQASSSTSGDDDDEHSRGPRGGEREKERRQANNARER